MERTHFFDRQFPTRSTSSIHGLVDRQFPTRSRPPVPDSVYLPHPWGRTASIHGRVSRMFLIQAISRIRAVVILISAVGMAIPSAAFATSWETSTMRAPGGGLIRIGMSRQEVLKELGQPLNTRSEARRTTTAGKAGTKGNVWTYRGSDGLYTLSFSREQVVKITVAPDRD